MEEESGAMRKVQEYRQRRDSGMKAKRGSEWMDDVELLQDAAEDGEVEVVQYLVEEVGVSVEVAGWIRRRPLHLAAQHGHLAVGQYLVLEGGADMEADRADGKRPLHLAALNGHHAFVEFLLEQGASVDAESRSGSRPLHLAAGSVHPSVVRCLLQRSIDINTQDCDGNTALHLAAGARFSHAFAEEERVLEVVELLVEEGEADPLLRNEEGKRASDSASIRRYSRVQRYLLEAEEMAEMQKQA